MGTTKARTRPGNTASLIYDELRRSILDGQLASGATVSQLLIARDHGTSRGPVREALRRLQQDRLVVAQANHRFCVASLDLSDLEAVLGLTLTIVTLAIRVGVPFLTDQDVQHLRHCAGAIEYAVSRDDGDRWEISYLDFVETITRYASARATLLSHQLHDDIHRYRANLKHDIPRIWYTGGQEFQQIAEAAASRDGKLAADIYADFMGRLSSLVIASTSPSYDASRLREYIAALSPSPKKR